MKKTNILVVLLTLFLLSTFIFLGCGKAAQVSDSGSGGSGGSTTNTVAKGPKSGKLIDPYVVGAVMYEDVNTNNKKDAGEQTSGPTDSGGNFTFSQDTTVGSIIAIDTSNATSTAKHIGVTFNANIRFKIDSTANTTMMVTPLTTLLANGWTEAQILSTLKTAGLTDLVTADLKADPMAGITNTSAAAITEADLKLIRAAQIVTSFLTIIDAIDKTGFSLTYEAFHSQQSRVDMLARVVTVCKETLTIQLFTDINKQIDGVNASLPSQASKIPALTAYDVVCGATAITNCVIQKVLTSKDYAYEPTVGQVNTWGANIGPKFYLLNHINDTAIQAGMDYGALNTLMGTTKATFATYKSFIVNPTTDLVEPVL